MGIFGRKADKKRKSYADGVYLEVPKQSKEHKKMHGDYLLGKDDISDIPGITLHELVKVVLERQGFKFGRLDMSGDYGVDFIVTLYGKTSIVRTVKYTKDTKMEAEIDKIAKAITQYNKHSKVDQAMLITNGKFTNAEQQYASGAQVYLVDGDTLLGWMEKVR